MVPVISPSRVIYGVRKLMAPLEWLALEGVLRAGEDMLMVHTHYGDQAIPSWVRWVLSDSKALCMHPVGAYESPWVPVQASLSWCALLACSCAPVPWESCCYGKANATPILPW